MIGRGIFRATGRRPRHTHPSARIRVPHVFEKRLLDHPLADATDCAESPVPGASQIKGHQNRVRRKHKLPMSHGGDRGADAIYLFNHVGLATDVWESAVGKQFLSDVASAQALRLKARHHPVTGVFPWAQDGEPRAVALPYTGSWGVFRLYLGPRPLEGQSTQIVLEIDGGQKPQEVRLNGTLCSWQSSEFPLETVRSSSGDIAWPLSFADWHVYEVPAEAVNVGYNVIEVGADEELTIKWVSIGVQ